MIRVITGRVLMVEAALLILPLMLSFYYAESPAVKVSFVITVAVCAAVGFLLSCKKAEEREVYMLDGFLIASFSWIFLSLFGALPFYLSGEIPSYIDALFETVSGFTTTGSSILTDVEAMSKSLLFWRSFTHLTGGMGVLVFASALLSFEQVNTVNMLKAEVPGPEFSKISPRLKDSARNLYKIYFGMTAILIVLLLLGGMNLFDACIHGFGAAGTGGFSNYAASVGEFDSLYIELVLGFGMLFFGVNFNLYFFLLKGMNKELFKNEELRWYLGIFISAVLAIALKITSVYKSFFKALRHSFFACSSIMTTAGFGTEDFTLWPIFTQIILLLLMFIGSCAGSTAGGLKVSRVAILIKSAINEIRRAPEHRKVHILKFEYAKVDKEQSDRVRNYFLVYIFLFIIFLTAVSLNTDDFLTAFSAVATCFNNIGPGLASIGPSSNFADFSPVVKLVLIFAMLAGRLEIYPLLVIFLPATRKTFAARRKAVKNRKESQKHIMPK